MVLRWLIFQRWLIIQAIACYKRENRCVCFYERETRFNNKRIKDIFAFIGQRLNYWFSLVCYFQILSLPLDERKIDGYDVVICFLDISGFSWISPLMVIVLVDNWYVKIFEKVRNWLIDLSLNKKITCSMRRIT